MWAILLDRMCILIRLPCFQPVLCVDDGPWGFLIAIPVRTVLRFAASVSSCPQARLRNSASIERDLLARILAKHDHIPRLDVERPWRVASWTFAATFPTSEPDDPQQESHAQRNRSSDSQDHDGDAECDAHRRKEVADDHSGATEWAVNDVTGPRRTLSRGLFVSAPSRAGSWRTSRCAVQAFGRRPLFERLPAR